MENFILKLSLLKLLILGEREGKKEAATLLSLRLKVRTQGLEQDICRNYKKI